MRVVEERRVLDGAAVLLGRPQICEREDGVVVTRFRERVEPALHLADHRIDTTCAARCAIVLAGGLILGREPRKQRRPPEEGRFLGLRGARREQEQQRQQLAEPDRPSQAPTAPASRFHIVPGLPDRSRRTPDFRRVPRSLTGRRRSFSNHPAASALPLPRLLTLRRRSRIRSLGAASRSGSRPRTGKSAAGPRGHAGHAQFAGGGGRVGEERRRARSRVGRAGEKDLPEITARARRQRSGADGFVTRECGVEMSLGRFRDAPALRRAGRARVPPIRRSQ